MTINLTVPQTMQELRPRITVVGVGGAGCNAVNNMISADLDGVDFLVANTDGQALAHSKASRKIQLGSAITQGLGAGSKPEIGRAAAEESIDDVMAELADCNMVFITAGMGGGTGTGAAPVIARAARERGILTVGVITKPFEFEGQRRMNQAESGIEELQAYVDTLIIIPNQNLFRLANERTTFADAFHMADTVLHQGVCGVTDLMIKPGMINLDFADIRAVMTEMGKAMMGTGEASGETRATQAAEAAINNPLLDDTTMKGASAVLINVTGGMDMTLFEVDEAANRIRKEVDPDAVIIFGSAFDEKLDGIMRVSVVATGIHTQAGARPIPSPMTAPIPAVQRPSTIIPPRAPSMPPMTTPDATVDAAGDETGDTIGDTTTDAIGDDLSGGNLTDTTEKATEMAPIFGFARKANVETPSPVEISAETSDADMDDAQAENTGTNDTGELQLDITDAVAKEMVSEAINEALNEVEAEIEAKVDAKIAADAEAKGAEETKDLAGGADDGKTISTPMVADRASDLVAPRPSFIPAPAAAIPDEDNVPEAIEPPIAQPRLIKRLKGLWSTKPGEENAEPKAAPAITETPAEKSNSILDLPRADMVQEGRDSNPQASLDAVDDDLDIPAFLRRQAN
ncbi:cell division protein FtsZ [Alphaproteobacteria bacterium]|nr:cell division protein FtsZ [Alphaproteobacteria bacterium]